MAILTDYNAAPPADDGTAVTANEVKWATIKTKLTDPLKAWIEAPDLDGNELILDADGDTSFHASTDDQIDIKIAGADDFVYVANIFRALSGSQVQTDTINETTAAAGVTVDGVLLKDSSATVADAAYDATTWNNSNLVPTRNAVRDKIVSMDAAITSATPSEGSFTPAISDGTNTATHSVALGRYRKSGNWVTISGRVFLSSLGSVSGNTIIEGLPFPAATITNMSFAIHFSGASGLNIPQYSSVTGGIPSGQDYISLNLWDSTGGNTSLQATEFSSDGSISFAGSYLAG